jgi:hypothetical protein
MRPVLFEACLRLKLFMPLHHFYSEELRAQNCLYRHFLHRAVLYSKMFEASVLRLNDAEG